jgi:hypothetical protein
MLAWQLQRNTCRHPPRCAVSRVPARRPPFAARHCPTATRRRFRRATPSTRGRGACGGHRVARGISVSLGRAQTRTWTSRVRGLVVACRAVDDGCFSDAQAATSALRMQFHGPHTSLMPWPFCTLPLKVERVECWRAGVGQGSVKAGGLRIMRHIQTPTKLSQRVVLSPVL